MQDNHDRLDVVKRKGGMHIIYITGAHGSIRFSDLQTHLTVTDPTISTRLEEQVEAGLLVRTFFDEMPPRVEYSLTPMAEELFGHLSALFEWAAQWTETGRPLDRLETHQQGHSRACVCCETAAVSETDVNDEGDETTWYRTVEGLINVLGKTYAMGVVVQVGEAGPIRYSEIKDRLDITTDAAVSTRLDQLQEAGFLDRRSYNQVPPRVEYSLTPAGQELAERLRPLLEWAERDS